VREAAAEPSRLAGDDRRMPTTTVHTGDAAELAPLSGFLQDWLAADPDQLGRSLAGYVEHPPDDPVRLNGRSGPPGGLGPQGPPRG
jgi:hypothetical protein